MDFERGGVKGPPADPAGNAVSRSRTGFTAHQRKLLLPTTQAWIASSLSGEVISGFVTKRSVSAPELLKTWRRRYVRVERTRVTWHSSDEPDSPALGELELLANSANTTGMRVQSNPKQISVTTKGQELRLELKDEEEVMPASPRDRVLRTSHRRTASRLWHAGCKVADCDRAGALFKAGMEPARVDTKHSDENVGPGARVCAPPPGRSLALFSFLRFKHRSGCQVQHGQFCHRSFRAAEARLRQPRRGPSSDGRRPNEGVTLYEGVALFLRLRLRLDLQRRHFSTFRTRCRVSCAPRQAHQHNTNNTRRRKTCGTTSPHSTRTSKVHRTAPTSSSRSRQEKSSDTAMASCAPSCNPPSVPPLSSDAFSSTVTPYTPE